MSWIIFVPIFLSFRWNIYIFKVFIFVRKAFNNTIKAPYSFCIHTLSDKDIIRCFLATYNNILFFFPPPTEVLIFINILSLVDLMLELCQKSPTVTAQQPRCVTYAISVSMAVIPVWYWSRISLCISSFPIHDHIWHITNVLNQAEPHPECITRWSDGRFTEQALAYITRLSLSYQQGGGTFDRKWDWNDCDKV